MKSYGQLWQKIVAEENLRAAWRCVRRGHAESDAVRAYERDLEANLAELRESLLSGDYTPSGYRQFRICEPKPRTISCAPVVDRIVHHALCGVIAPCLERSFVPFSFACRRGFGAHAACALARRYAARAAYFCKMDVRHYFDSVSHDRLLDAILPKFREGEVRRLVERIVRCAVPGQGEGRGLPIGNLTSQWFANGYLDAFDHAVLSGFGTHGAKCVGYVRYMDDLLFFASSKAEAWQLHDLAKSWLATNRGLELKEEATVVAPVSEGVPFLGLRIWAHAWRLQRGRFLRTRRSFSRRVRQFAAGQLDAERFALCAASGDGASRWFGFRGILGDLATGEGASCVGKRVMRGGSWNNDADNCTSSNRNNNNPDNANSNIGFRLISTMSGQAGSHPVMPALCGRGDEHASGNRPVVKANAAVPHPLR